MTDISTKPVVNGLAKSPTRWGRELEAKLEAGVLGFPILTYDSVTSTNDVVKNLAELGAPEGLAVVAREQTIGRGKMGARWCSPQDHGVYLSVLIKPEMIGTDIRWLAILGSLATAESLKKVKLKNVSVKWPNDVISNKKKIAGVLVEPRVGQKKVHFAVLGIGINISQTKHDLDPEIRSQATSCILEGLKVQRDKVIVRVLESMDHWYVRVKAGEIESLFDAWRAISNGEQIPEASG